MGILLQQGSTFIESDEPAQDGYGQPAYRGASSDLPGQKTTTPKTSKVAPPQVVLPAESDTKNHQTRTISAEQYAPAHGLRSRQAPGGMDSIPKLGEVGNVPMKGPNGGYRPSSVRVKK